MAPQFLAWGNYVEGNEIGRYEEEQGVAAMGWNGEETEKWFVARINRVKKLIWRSKEECIT